MLKLLNTALILLFLFSTVLFSQHRTAQEINKHLNEMNSASFSTPPQPIDYRRDNWGELNNDIPWDYSSKREDTLSPAYEAAYQLQLREEGKEQLRIQNLANPTSSQQVLGAIIEDIFTNSSQSESDTISEDIETATIVNLIQSREDVPIDSSVTTPIAEDFVTIAPTEEEQEKPKRKPRNCVFFTSIYYGRPFSSQRGDL